MAERGVASPRILADIDTLLQWFKIKGATPEARLATWQSMDLEAQRKHHETLAYNFEIYLFDGKAPTSKLERVFAKIRTFILAAYENIRDQLNAIYRDQFGTDLPGLTPEVRLIVGAQANHERLATNMGHGCVASSVRGEFRRECVGKAKRCRPSQFMLVDLVRVGVIALPLSLVSVCVARNGGFGSEVLGGGRHSEVGRLVRPVHREAQLPKAGV